MCDIDKLIDNYRQQLTVIARKMEKLAQAGDILIDKIANTNNLVDDEGNSPRGVSEPVIADHHKDKLLNDIEVVAKSFMELQDEQSKLISYLQSLLSRTRF